MGAMLGAHSDCICPPESQFVIDVLRSWDQDGANLLTALNTIKSDWRFKLWALDIDPTTVPETKLGVSYPRLLEWIVARYAKNLGKTNARIWVDHTPRNMRYASTLLELFPQAKMIHIVRDGRGVASSVLPLDWGPNTIIKAALWWLAKIAHGLAVETLLEGHQIIRVKYEDLVCAPEETLRNLCAYLGIEYQAEMAQGGGFKPPRYTRGQHTLIEKGPDVTRATRWETCLTPRQIEIFESLTHDFLRYLDYPLKYGLKAKIPTFREKRMAGIRGLSRSAMNKTRQYARRNSL